MRGDGKFEECDTLLLRN